jgi:hypothetical protein
VPVGLLRRRRRRCANCQHFFVPPRSIVLGMITLRDPGSAGDFDYIVCIIVVCDDPLTPEQMGAGKILRAVVWTADLRQHPEFHRTSAVIGMEDAHGIAFRSDGRSGASGRVCALGACGHLRIVDAAPPDQQVTRVGKASRRILGEASGGFTAPEQEMPPGGL